MDTEIIDQVTTYFKEEPEDSVYSEKYVLKIKDNTYEIPKNQQLESMSDEEIENEINNQELYLQNLNELINYNSSDEVYIDAINSMPKKEEIQDRISKLKTFILSRVTINPTSSRSTKKRL